MFLGWGLDLSSQAERSYTLVNAWETFALKQSVRFSGLGVALAIGIICELTNFVEVSGA